jgi:NADH-quinone oxidoreductase subunit M
VSHGSVFAILFLLTAALARRVGTSGFGAGGLAARTPVLMSLFVIAILAVIGLPGTSGAPGELLILAAAFAWSPGIGLLATVVPVACAAYGIRVLRAVFFGPSAVPTSDGSDGSDLGWRERGLVIALIALVFAVGVAPRSVGDLADRASAPLTELRR